MADDIRLWSEELARDPGSMVFVPLGDALRRRGQLDHAQKIATRGLERHPYDADAHDLLARIWADRGDVERAMDEWSAALQIAPGHGGALKGMGFACFHAGRSAEAERHLVAAAAADPEDPNILAALERVRELVPGPPSTNGTEAVARPAPVSESAESAPPVTEEIPAAEAAGRDGAGGAGGARTLFAELMGEGEQSALLLDAQGFVLAGTYVVADGREVAQEVAAALTGVSDEARRAMRHLGLGDWASLVFEAEVATVAMGPVSVGGDEALVLVAAARSVPLGLVRRLLLRVAERATAWLSGVMMRAGGSP